MADQFIIEEMIGNDRIKVILEDHEMPFGRPRRHGAFDLGGPVNHEAIFLDGRIEPIIHAKQPQFHPVVISGHFRDRFSGNLGQAWAFVQQLEQLRQNMRPLKLSWWQLSWTAFMTEGKFPVEGENDFTYEMRFRILTGPGTKPAVRDQRSLVTVAPADLASQVRALIAADRAKMLALFITRIAAGALDQAYANLDSALSNVEDTAAAFESAPARADAESKALIGKAEEAKSRCDDIQALADGSAPTSPAPALLPGATADAEAAYWAWLCQAALDLVSTKDSLRTMQLTARQRINAATKLYQVADGDTLESIARTQLGSAARAGELGYRPSDIKPGKMIRIPAVV